MPLSHNGSMPLFFALTNCWFSGSAAQLCIYKHGCLKINEIIIFVENKFGNLRDIDSSKQVLHQLIFFAFQNNVKYTCRYFFK